MSPKMCLYYILIVFSVLLFFQGFFPITKKLGKFNNDPPTHINNSSLNKNKVYTTDIQKTVIVVIDALRLDFVTTQLMPLTSNITRRKGCFNKVSVETPTVTLPRIKALTAGFVPQFIDLVLNLAGTEILEDSLIHSAFNQQKRIVFYGDDTWLKLFPNFFTRYEGTSSFFVRDFKEVDDNVTRNVEDELSREDWDIMILHYLGLDHIGHVYGPFSSLIPKKLQEMDNIIYKIHSKMALRKENTLLLITGDHGMKDGGGHGGSTYSETHVPLLAVGITCHNHTFPQIDIPANLAVLLGLNIPSTSIGQLRDDLLTFFSTEKLLFVLRYNTLLLLQKGGACSNYFHDASKSHELYLQNFHKTDRAYAAAIQYMRCSEIISERLIKSSVTQNLSSLIIAMLIMSNVLMVLLKQLIFQTSFNLCHTIEPLTFLVIVLIQYTMTVDMISVIFILILGIILVLNVLSLFRKIYNVSNDISRVLILFSIIHPVTFLSSSFVEEEHQFWYYLNNLFILINIIQLWKDIKLESMLRWTALLVAVRFLRTINSTGDKWATYPDVSDFLLKTENYYLYLLFFILGLGTTFYFQCLLNHDRKVKTNILNLVIFVLIFIFKILEYQNILLGKLIWGLILFHAIFLCGTPKICTWILVSTLLLKPYNVVLISYCIFTSLCYSAKFKDTTILTLCHSWLGYMLFFMQGHSNSLASVDISVGYAGLSEYNPIFVITQVVCHTYGLPVLCHFLILRSTHIDDEKVWAILFCNRLFIILVTCIITLVHKDHLFIWSVFAPKLFIEIVHTIFLFVEFSVYYSFKNIRRVLSGDNQWVSRLQPLKRNSAKDIL